MPTPLHVALLAALLLWPAAAVAALDDPAPAKPDVTLTGHERAVASVAFSPDGKRLASVDQNGVIKVWDVAAKKQLVSVEITVGRSHQQVRFTPDGKSVVALSAVGLAVFDAESGKAAAATDAADISDGPTAFAVAPDGKTVAVVGHATLRFFDLATGAAKAAYDVHAGHDVTGVAYSPDGTRVATAGDDGSAVVRDAATGKELATVKTDVGCAFAQFTPDGKRLITATSTGVLRSTDLATGDGRPMEARAVARTMDLSADGKTLVVGGYGRAPHLVTVADGKAVAEAYEAAEDVYSAAISPDGTRLAGGVTDGSVCLWKVAR